MINRVCVNASTDLRAHFEVSNYLQSLNDHHIRRVGGALGVAYDIMEKMKNLPGDMVAAWLRREEYVSEDPTWRSLIKALKRVGQRGIAEKIEAERR